jgi:hypothetical protein
MRCVLPNVPVLPGTIKSWNSVTDHDDQDASHQPIQQPVQLLAIQRDPPELFEQAVISSSINMRLLQNY